MVWFPSLPVPWLAFQIGQSEEEEAGPGRGCPSKSDDKVTGGEANRWVSRMSLAKRERNTCLASDAGNPHYATGVTSRRRLHHPNVPFQYFSHVILKHALI